MAPSAGLRPYQRYPFLREPYNTRMSGIYAILNKNNGKVYIGSAVNLSHRWSCHRHDIARGRHGNIYLSRAFKSNPDAFYFEVIEELPGASKETILSREQFWMDFFKSYLPENGYNIAPKAESCQGIKRGSEFIEKLLAARRKPWSEERRAAWKEFIKRRPVKTGWKHSPETLKKMSDGHKGKKLSREHVNKVMEAIRRNKKGFNKKPIHQFDLQGNHIRTFQSVTDAEKLFGRRGNIHGVCKGKRRQAFGFVWRYSDG